MFECNFNCCCQRKNTCCSWWIIGIIRYGFISAFHPIRDVISNNVSVISGICEAVPVSRPAGSAARAGGRQECGGVHGYVQGLTSAEPP